MAKLQRFLGPAVVVGALLFFFFRPSGSISSEQAHALVEKQGALLLDVRTPEEFAAGHVEGATNIPVQELESKLTAFPAKKDQHVVVYCRSGARSARATEILKTAGYANAVDLGGISNWKN